MAVETSTITDEQLLDKLSTVRDRLLREIRKAIIGQDEVVEQVMLSLFVGAFLIYLTLSVAVVERTRTYGTLRAVGATPRQLRRVVLAEALALGIPATVGGLLLGAGLAWLLVGVIAGLVDVPRPSLLLQPSAIIIGVVIGLGATMLASLIPARRAARISPVVAMRRKLQHQ